MPSNREIIQQNRNALTRFEEEFCQAIATHKSDRLEAYKQAYPLEAKMYTDSTLRARALSLQNRQAIKNRIGDITRAVANSNNLQAMWTRADSIRELSIVVERAQGELARAEAGAEAEIGFLVDELDGADEKTQTQIGLKIAKLMQKKRMAMTPTNAVINAVSELNKMQGYDGDTVELGEIITITGEAELLD